MERMMREQSTASSGRGMSYLYRDPDAEWKKIQQNTFTRWVNRHLKKANSHIENLETDFSDGLKLIALAEVLSHKEVPSHNKRPKIRMQQLENVSIALEFLEKEGVVLVSIDSSHIVDGKLKLILGLVWALILHFSISMTVGRTLSDVERKTKTPKQQLLDWVKEKCPDLKVANFTSDWKDGKAIGCLVDSTGPGLCPNWKDWDPKRPVENATEAMDLAENWLGVEKLLAPEEMVNPNIDEQSMMTYLSQFPEAKLKPGAPLQEKDTVPDIKAYGPGLESNGVTQNIPTHFTIELIGSSVKKMIVAIMATTGRKVPCEVVESFSDGSDGESKTIFNCSYLAIEEGEIEITILLGRKLVAKSPYLVRVEGPATNILNLTANGSGSQFEVTPRDANDDDEKLKSLKKACYLKEGSYARQPAEAESHFVEISKISDGKYKWKNSANVEWYLVPVASEDNLLEVGKECPYYKDGYTSANFNENGIYGPFDDFYVYQGCRLKEGIYIRIPAEKNYHFVEILRKSEGHYEWKNNDDVKWSLTHRTGEGNLVQVGQDCPYYEDGYTSAKFNETGILGPMNEFYTYQECTLREGSYIHKPPKNKAHFVEISKPFEDSYQWTNGSHEKWSLAPVVGERNVLRVGIECPHFNSGYSFAQFNEAGIYGPSNEFYAYQGNVYVALNHLKVFPLHQKATFHMQVEANDDAELIVVVKGPSSDPSVEVTGNSKTGFLAAFTPNEVGPYQISVEYNKVPVSGTPYVGNSFDSSKVVVSEIPKGTVGRPLRFDVDTSKAGKGNLEIKVFANNETVPVSTSKLSSSEKHEISFVPLTDVDHRIEIDFNKDKVLGSPFVVQIEHAVVHWKGILISSGPKSKTKDGDVSDRDSITANSRSSSVDDSSSSDSDSSDGGEKSGIFKWFSRKDDDSSDEEEEEEVKMRKDTAKAFFDSCWKGNGWEKCKDYCAPNAIFRSQAMLFHPPMASESDLGGSLEAYVDWVKVMATKVLPKCYLTDVAYVYDAKTNIAIFSGIFNAKHSKTPRVSQLPPPTKKSVKSDYVYRIHFNAKGKIDSLVKIWNSEWFQKELGWMD